MTRYMLTLSLGLAACGPGLPGEAAPGSTSSTGGAAPTTGEASTTSVVMTTDGAAETRGETTTGAGTASTSSWGDDGTFLIPLDGVHADACNIFTQDCPPGEKCMPYADDGGTSWNNDKCVPVMENPAQVGEPCFVVGSGVSGLDNCDHGLMCWDTDAENNGLCVELCSGSAEAGMCNDPFKVCAIYGGGALALCLDGCDPLAQNCDPSDVCLPNPDADGFWCVLDASGEEGQQHDACALVNECDPGLICGEPAAAVECDQDATGCCEPFCDLTDPDADANCGGVGQVCNPYFEEGTAPPDYEDVGYCAVPM